MYAFLIGMLKMVRTLDSIKKKFIKKLVFFAQHAKIPLNFYSRFSCRLIYCKYNITELTSGKIKSYRTAIRRLLLYPTELRMLFHIFKSHFKCVCKAFHRFVTILT